MSPNMTVFPVFQIFLLDMDLGDYKKNMKTVHIKLKLFVLFTYENIFGVCPFENFNLERLKWMLKVVYTLNEN